jgi:uncharacterized protein (TIGR03437 family)
LKNALRILVIMGIGVTALAQVRLPESRRLAGPLDSGVSAFGDEFFNFPPAFQGRAEPGSTYLTGWIAFDFDEPREGYAWFRMRLDAVGTSDEIAFPGGQTYQLLDNRAFSNPDLVSTGRLDLRTGEIDRLEVHTVFRNSVIARVTRNIRIPFGFINDYPPVNLPVPLPFSDRPPVFSEAKFQLSADGAITGFEFRGETLAPVTLFPRLGLFPPYAFAEEQRFYFANPDGCLPGTPPDRCYDDESYPDGVPLAANAFFHPHLELLTTELRPVPTSETPANCLPLPSADAAGAVSARGRVVLVGGGNGGRVADWVRVLDPATGLWQTLTRPPIPVTDAQAAGLGSRILVVGGRSPVDGSPVAWLQVFDLESGRWTQQTPALAAVHSGFAAAADSRIFVIGGREEDPDGTSVPSRKLQIYDPDRDVWTLGASPPASGDSAAVAVAGGRIFLIGGRDAAGAGTNAVWIYDPGEDRWEPGPATIHPVLGGAAAGLEGRLFLLGGRSSAEGPTLNVLQVLGLNQGEWRIGPTPPLAVSEASAAVVGGKVYFMGGRTMTGPDTFPGQVQDVVQAYDVSSGWSVCPSRPVFAADDVLSAACGAAGPPELSPGARVVILGHHLAPSTRTAPTIRTDGGWFTTDYPLALEGVEIRLDGHPAPLISVSPESVEFQVPWSFAAEAGQGRMVSLEFRRAGSPMEAPPIRLPLVASAPSLYVHSYGEYHNLDYLEGASAQARNEDGSVNSPSRPANRGSTMTLYLTGLGSVAATLDDGQRAPSDVRAATVAEVRAEIGGLPATVEWAGALPLEIGVYEVRVQVPDSVSPGNNVPVEVIVEGRKSNLARIAVR